MLGMKLQHAVEVDRADHVHVVRMKGSPSKNQAAFLRPPPVSSSSSSRRFQGAYRSCRGLQDSRIMAAKWMHVDHHIATSNWRKRRTRSPAEFDRDFH